MRERRAIREAVTVQVGDPCDLSWLVFDLSQLGAMMNIHAEHYRNVLAERFWKKDIFLSAPRMKHVLLTTVWILLFIHTL